jgi:N-acyl homoserine lactone hydrolase
VAEQVRTRTDPAVAVELDVILAGEIPMPYPYVFRPAGGNALARLAHVLRPEGKPLRAPLLAFVLRHPEAGPILVDTGLHRGATEDLRRDYGRGLSLLFRKLRPGDQPFDEQLRALGVEPGDVKLVVMTHLHVDHTGGMRLLPNAEFVCAREEWSAATGPRASLAGVASGHLPDESRMRLLDFGRDGEPHDVFERTIDLLGDGSLRLISTSGHTPGHLSVLPRLAGGREVLLVGDAAYTTRSIHDQRLPLFTASDRNYTKSLRELERYAGSHPEAILVPFHDPEAWRRL